MGLGSDVTARSVATRLGAKVVRAVGDVGAARTGANLGRRDAWVVAARLVAALLGAEGKGRCREIGASVAGALCVVYDLGQRGDWVEGRVSAGPCSAALAAEIKGQELCGSASAVALTGAHRFGFRVLPFVSEEEEGEEQEDRGV